MRIIFKNPPSIRSYASVGGREEYEGPLGSGLDFHDSENRFSADTWEKSESEMQRTALSLALAKGSLKSQDLDVLFAGDLINQCTSSTFGLLEYEVPFVGLFGACSTAAESLALASLFVDTGYVKTAAAVTSSHFCSAERQFRFPLEYGGQRAPTCQRTATASGAFVLSSDKGNLSVSDVMFGISRDGGITDANNMGAAMAPAAMDTLTRYFRESGTKPSDYDGIFTGDLGWEGYKIVRLFAKEQGYDLDEVYQDCGLLIYDREKQDMHAGGSGCGCSAMVLAAKILPDMEMGRMSDILFIGTGALMSPSSVQQGLSIPGIAHLVHIRANGQTGRKGGQTA